MKTYFPIAFALILIGLGCNSTPKEGSSTGSMAVEKNTAGKKTIVFFGNSLTYGYGLANPREEGFVGLTQKCIDSLGLGYRCVNMGVSGNTTADGLSRIDFSLTNVNPDIFILELGANDGLRGLSVPDAEKNLQAIIDKVKIKNPAVKIILAGMEASPSLGQKYTGSFHDIYPRLAKQNNISLIPFILDKVGGISELNQSDGIHPTAQGNKIVSQTIWNELSKELKN
jgi:acyl-CoA thioesterase I